MLVNGISIGIVERGGDGYFYNWNGHEYFIHGPTDSLFMDGEEQITNNMNNRM